MIHAIYYRKQEEAQLLIKIPVLIGK